MSGGDDNSIFDSSSSPLTADLALLPTMVVDSMITFVGKVDWMITCFEAECCDCGRERLPRKVLVQRVFGFGHVTLRSSVCT